MMYPFLKLDDDTEIVHSEMLPDGQVKVYMEQPVDGGFNSATCMLPSYVWSDIEGYTPEQIDRYREVIESTSHLILKYATTGGYSYASGF